MSDTPFLPFQVLCVAPRISFIIFLLINSDTHTEGQFGAFNHLNVHVFRLDLRKTMRNEAEAKFSKGHFGCDC